MSSNEIKAMLVRQGASHTDAHLIVDIAEHASVQMADALSRVVDTAPVELRATVMLLAARMTVATLTGFLNEAAREMNQMDREGL